LRGCSALPKDAACWLSLGEVQLALGQVQEARATFQSLPKKKKGRRAEILLGLDACDERQGDDEGAIKRYLSGEKLAPKWSIFPWLRGRALQRLGREDEATAVFRNVSHTTWAWQLTQPRTRRMPIAHSFLLELADFSPTSRQHFQGLVSRCSLLAPGSPLQADVLRTFRRHLLAVSAGERHDPSFRDWATRVLCSDPWLRATDLPWAQTLSRWIDGAPAGSQLA
jgi:hypothetical protein